MKRILLRNLFFCFLGGVFLSSCISKKQIAYFQKAQGEHDTISVAQAYVPKIQAGDILSITVSSLNSMASSFFNPFSNTTSDNATNSTLNGIPAVSNATGFLVDTAGMVELPLVGAIKIAGLTTSSARDVIKARLNVYLKEPTVNVRFLNYKISVMGEVAHPSVYVIPNERITLPEALSMAGDLTIYAMRNNVMIIRDVAGKKEFGHVNLTGRDLYDSPYYYLHANDVVYVEPNRAKRQQIEPVFKILPVVLSAVSVLMIVIYYSRR